MARVKKMKKYFMETRKKFLGEQNNISLEQNNSIWWY